MGLSALSYDIIKSVINTEKSSLALEGNKYSFYVLKKCDKVYLKTTVEALFSVKVKKVNILNTTGKVKKFRGKKGKLSDLKKAVITLQDGYSINYSKIN